MSHLREDKVMEAVSDRGTRVQVRGEIDDE